MRKISLAELKQVVDNSADGLQQQADNVGRCIKIYNHWSAGRYGQFFNEYPIEIDSDGSIYLNEEDLSIVGQHTYHRNSGSIGIGLSCAYNATSNDLGDYPPTAKQIESLCKVNAVVLQTLSLPCDIEHLMTHGEAGDNEDGVEAFDAYGPKSTCERWDLEYLGTDESQSFNTDDIEHRGGTIIRGKTAWYMNQYQDGVENHF
jgi:hypothetical protein